MLERRMGGLGSGRYERNSARKHRVEECLSLDANCWMREGILAAGIGCRNTWSWFRGTRKVASVEFDSDCSDSQVWLSYTLASGEQVAYSFRLDATEPNYGGLRWWFLCPLDNNGRPCNRRVSKLYLPRDGRYFGCRQCHDLSYRSSQEAHQDERREDWLAKAIADLTGNRIVGAGA
jgi:hypothetical protein